MPMSLLQALHQSLEVLWNGRLEHVLVDAFQRVPQDESHLGLGEAQAVRNGLCQTMKIILWHGSGPMARHSRITYVSGNSPVHNPFQRGCEYNWAISKTNNRRVAGRFHEDGAST
jgi:hypothetical protein